MCSVGAKHVLSGGSCPHLNFGNFFNTKVLKILTIVAHTENL